jgi:hypothetical protein
MIDGSQKVLNLPQERLRLWMMKPLRTFGIVIFLLVTSTTSAISAELLLNPREVFVRRFITGQSPTLVIADRVNVRSQPSTYGTSGNFVFARLDEGDEVYVLSCEGFSDGYFWVEVWIPEIGEIGYVAAQYLQNNYQGICDLTRPY